MDIDDTYYPPQNHLMSLFKNKMPSTYRTAEQTKTENVHAMGEELGLRYNALWQDVAWLHQKWAEYVALFGTKSSRIDLLNEAAPAFFRIVQDILWKEILLHIARLTDPPEIGKKQNLSVRQIEKFIPHENTKTYVNQLIDEADIASEFCRDWRNRNIAHRDLDLALTPDVKPLQAASREKVRDALKAIVAILNAISAHYKDGATTIFDSHVGPGGAMSLLYVIDDGLKADAARQKRLKDGYFEPEEFAPKDL